MRGGASCTRPGPPPPRPPARRLRRGAAEAVDLTTAEFELLRSLLASAGRVVSREDLFRAVLEREFSNTDRGIDNLISALRRKLGPATDGEERIKAIRGVGYLYAHSRSHTPQ